MVNARERLLETFRFGNPDRPFRWECVAYWGEAIERWKGEGLVGHPDQYFEMDKQVSFLGFHSETNVQAGFTGTPYVPPLEAKVLSEDEKTRVVRDSNGIVRRELKTSVSMPQWLEYPVKNREDFEALKERLDPDDPRRYPEGWEKAGAKYTDRDYPISMPVCGFFGHLRNLVGPTRVSYFMYREPALIRHILKHWSYFDATVIGRVKDQIDLDCVLFWEDMCYRNGPLISPRLFEKFLLPCYRRVSSRARRLGIDTVCVDTDGNVEALLPLFVQGGVNAMVPFEVQAGNDILEIRRRYPRLVIYGGLNKLALTRDRARIDAELTKVGPMLEAGGYIPSLDHAAPPDIPFENFRYYIERIRKIEDRYASA